MTKRQSHVAAVADGSVTPDADKSRLHAIKVSGELVINAPTNMSDGDSVLLLLKFVDRSYKLTWDAAYKGHLPPTMSVPFYLVQVVCSGPDFYAAVL
jgi:hypothetical protein